MGKEVASTVNRALKHALGSDQLNASVNALYLGDHTAICRLQEGLKLFVDTRDRSLAPHLLMDGHWEPWIRNFLFRQVSPGMTFVDVGANFGYYTILLGSIVGSTGRVFSFEPNPRLADLLAWSIHINGQLPWTMLSRCAVGEANGKAQFGSATHYMGSSSLYITQRHADAWRDKVVIEEVEICTLDETLPKDGQVHLLKIDAEGAEPRVFAGAQRVLERNPEIGILFEFMPGSYPGGYPEGRRLLETLRSQGFRFWDITSDSEGRAANEEELLKRSWSEIFASRKPPR